MFLFLQILTEILKQSSIPLKTCRLVSHFWNKMVLTLPNTKLALNLKPRHQNFGTDPAPFFELCNTLDDRLAKRISARTPFFAEASYSFAAKMIYLCGKFSQRVESLGILLHFEDCLPHISQIFSNSCPNLKQLRIRCMFDGENYVPSPEILAAPFPRKPNLTVFRLHSAELAVSPALTTFTQLVVAAAPNLKKLVLPWGVYPDLENSKFLDSLTLKLDLARSLEVVLRDYKPSELARMLGQVGDHVVHLAFSCYGSYNKYSKHEDYDLVDNSTRSRIRLPGRMLKLRTFKNDMLDIIQHADLWRDIEGMPGLETLWIGKISRTATSVDAFLKNLSEKERVFRKVTDLRIQELYDPTLLARLKTAFPNLKTLGLDSLYEMEEGGMELGVVLKACVGWGGLKHLRVRLPTYPERMWDFIKALLDGSELYKGEG